MEKASPTASYSAAICGAAWTLGGTPTTLGGFPVPAPLRPGMVDAVHTTAMKRRLRVLVVNDDKAVLKSTIPMLDTLGYTAISAASGAEALPLVASEIGIDK